MDRLVREVIEAGLAEARVWSQHARLRRGYRRARTFWRG